MKNYLILMILGSVFSCAEVSPKRLPSSAGFTNPIYDSGTSFADPAVLEAADGHYYAYATQSRVKGKIENVQCARSSDLVNWERLPDCMPSKPEWANQRQNFWAPHVSYFNGKYVMYLSAEQNEWGYCIAAGVSDRPQGPFINFKRLVCGKGFEHIDPMAFEDPKTGRKFVYWGSASMPLKGQELTGDGLEILPKSEMKIVLKNTREPRGLLKDRDGWVYALGTQMGAEFENKSNLQAMRSKDFENWEKLPDAMPVRPNWATGNPDHWAPQLLKKGNKYYVYLTIQKSKEVYCISRGEAMSAAGPFEKFIRLDCSKDYKLVNPLLHQNDDGPQFLAWEDPTWKKLVSRSIDESGKRFVGKASSEPLMKSPFRFKRKGYEDLVEGAWVTYRQGHYYLYYSGDECCSEEARYAVSVARSDNPLGPFEKKGVILKGDKRWLGPGHNSIVSDKKGQEWIVYHAIPAANPKIKVNEKETEVNRLMLMDQIHYDVEGWPEVKGLHPQTKIHLRPENEK